MSFTPNQIASNLVGRPEHQRKPWEFAPKEILEAFKAANEASEAHRESAVNVQVAEVNAQTAQAEWDAKALELVRADKPLPSRDDLDRANLKVIAATQDVHDTRLGEAKAEVKLGGLLSEEANRDKWLEAMNTQLEAAKKKLAAKAPEVIELTDLIQQLQAFSTFLVVWPQYGNPEMPQHNYVSTTISEALNAQLHAKPVEEPSLVSLSTEQVLYRETPIPR